MVNVCPESNASVTLAESFVLTPLSKGSKLPDIFSVSSEVS